MDDDGIDLATVLQSYEVVRSGPGVRLRCTRSSCRLAAPPGRHLVAYGARMPLPAVLAAIAEHERVDHPAGPPARPPATGRPVPGVRPLDVACPRCEQPANRACTTESGLITVPHSDRFTAAAAALAESERPS